MGVGLHGRDTVLVALGEGLLQAGQSSHAHVVVIEGAPGSGKTQVCAHAAQMSAAAGFSVIRVAGVEGEADLPLAGLSMMLGPLRADLDRLTERLPPRQRLALATAAGLGEDHVTDRFTLGAAVLGLLGALSETQPLLVVIDDAHWLDQPSAQGLAFALRRLGADAVLTVIASRTGQSQIVLPEDSSRVEITGLDESEVAATLADSGLACAPSVVAAITEGTGGLPLAVLETARALSPAQRAGEHRLPQPLPIGRDITRVYRARLADLPERARHTVAVVAAAGSAPLPVLRTALARMDLDLSDLQSAEERGVLSVDSRGVEFTHPLLRAAALQLATPTERRGHHQALADAAGDDLELRARHLAASVLGPDDHIAAVVEQAADEVTRRGGIAAAAPLLAQAVELSEPGITRQRRQVAAALALAVAGQNEQAVTHARAVMATTTDPVLRADAAQVVVDCSYWGAGGEALLDVARQEARRVAPVDPTRAIGSLVQAATIAMIHAHVVPMVALGEEAVSHLTPDTPADMRSAAHQMHAFALLMHGRHPEAQPIMDQWAPKDLEHITAADPNFVRYPNSAYVLMRLGRYREAGDLADALVKVCNRESTPTAKAYALAAASQVRWWTGRWPQALAMGAQSAELCEQTGQLGLQGFVSATTGAILADLGEEQRCRGYVDTAMAIAHTHNIPAMRYFALATLGLLELGLGDAETAVPALLEADHLRRSREHLDPSSIPFGQDLVEALALVGRRREALAALEEHSELARVSELPWANAAMLRCRGILTEDPDESDTHFAAALALHPPELAFDTARTQMCWGQRLRRRRDITASRDHLDRARNTFERLGARAWARRAAAELRAAGGKRAPHAERGPDLGVLTPQELNCALAVAEGMSNRDAAAALFISPKTVEYHLSKAYTKLGVISRTQLARLLERSEPATPTSG